MLTSSTMAQRHLIRHFLAVGENLILAGMVLRLKKQVFTSKIYGLHMPNGITHNVRLNSQNWYWKVGESGANYHLQQSFAKVIS